MVHTGGPKTGNKNKKLFHLSASSLAPPHVKSWYLLFVHTEAGDGTGRWLQRLGSRTPWAHALGRWEHLWYKVRARGEDLKHLRCTVSEYHAEGGWLLCALRSRKPSACIIISDDHVCGRTQRPQPQHKGLKQPRRYHWLFCAGYC